MRLVFDTDMFSSWNWSIGAVTQELTFFCCPPPTTCRCSCGTDREPRVCEHKWDGEEEAFDGGLGQSATCSKCGMLAMSHDMRCGP